MYMYILGVATGTYYVHMLPSAPFLFQETIGAMYNVPQQAYN